MSKVSGIYLITCRPEGGLPRYYVGQSIDVFTRKKSHFSALKSRRHSNKKLQNAFEKHGSDAFSFDLLEECQSDRLNDAEFWWITEMISHQRCFNIGTDPVKWARGATYSAEHRQRIALAISGERHYLYGKSHPQSVRDKISASGKGKNRSAQTRERISAANAGEKNSMFGKTGEQHQRSKPVIGTSILTGDSLIFGSACLAERHGFHQAAISRCCNGISASHKGYLWRFAD
jgi:group I intron endonuclease